VPSRTAVMTAARIRLPYPQSSRVLHGGHYAG
jgi:hypothetical protein